MNIRMVSSENNKQLVREALTDRYNAGEVECNILVFYNH